MTVLSKSEFENALINYKCCELLHPWSESCLKGNFIFFIYSFVGGLKFFAIMYTVTTIFKIKAKKKIDFKKELNGFMRSMLFISIFCTLFTAGNCFFRKVLGKFSYHVVVRLVPFLCGVPCFLESQSRLTLNSTTFLTGALEGAYRTHLRQGIVRSTTFGETLVFMLINGSLMYSLRARKEQNDNTWFFTPSKIKYLENNGPQRECSHNGVCTRSLLKDVFTYGGVALLISSLKLILLNFRNPSRALNQVTKWNTWKFASFVASYIGIFKIVSCYLCQTRGDSLLNTSIAGFLAGLSYAISPKITILFSTLTALLKTVGSQFKKNYNLPNLPYMETSFILSNAYLFYLLFFDEQSCPKYIYSMVKMITSNKVIILFDNLHDIMRKQLN